LPVSAPAAQRSVSGSKPQAAGLATTPSTMPSFASQAWRTAAASVATFAGPKPAGSTARAFAVRLKAPIAAVQS